MSVRISRRTAFASIIAGTLFARSGRALAQTVEYTYDALGRVTRVEYANGSVITYSYDAAGNRTEVVQSLPPPQGAFTATIPITHTGPINLRTIANTFGYDGARNATVIFTIPSPVTIIGAAGASAIDTGTWPTGAYAINLDLQISGNVYGGGGRGGEGAQVILPNAQAGGLGGDAIYCRLPIDVVVNAGGAVKAGGGGGGGGGGWYNNSLGDLIPGGGGGGGFPNGAGAQNAGQNGTTSGGGAGGPVAPPTGRRGGAGGAGGGIAAGGSGGTAAAGGGGVGWTIFGPASGGAAGFAIRKNGNTVNVTNNGTITGTVG